METADSRSDAVVDSQYAQLDGHAAEVSHLYGEQVHILNDVGILTQLAQVCAVETVQPAVNRLIELIYTRMLGTVLDAEFPRVRAKAETRMISDHKEAVFRGPVLDRTTRAVTVNLARAGTLPSHVVYMGLNEILDPRGVRQDHVGIARATNALHQVSGSVVSGHKIGGTIADSILVIPDPMGATGSTVVEALSLFAGYGRPKKVIAIHCIVTPEYLKHVLEHAKKIKWDVAIYAARLDRGLSSPEVLASIPGEKWSQEKGLNSKQYIVPGGGGLGEVMNNAYV